MEIYTMQQWMQDRDLKVQVGQIIAWNVFYQLLGAVPPRYFRNGMFQVGEPYSHDWNTGQALYKTFKLETNGYKYVGLMVGQD